MPVVTVDLDDLETIIFATGAIKTIEGVLASRRSDPFVQPHLDFKAAHDRLGSAMRDVRRAEAGTLVNYSEPLTVEEVTALREIDFGKDVLSQDEKAPNKKKKESMSVYDRLAAKGMVVMGNFVRGVVWAGASAPEIVPDPKGFAIKLTNRGRAALATDIQRD